MISLQIQDADILRKLVQYTDDPSEQERVALSALRIGLEALTAIRGEIDKQSLQQVGYSILEQIQGTVVEVLEDHRQTLLGQFSMDIPDSAMQRLNSQITQSYTSVRDEVINLSQKRNYERRSTQGGAVFEEELGSLLQCFAYGTKDLFEAIGNKAGKKDKNRVGDFLITLGETCHAPGENIVIEAKRDASYTLDRARKECQIARQNRSAQICIFVWDRDSCAGKHPPLQRYGSDVVVLWDATDENTDIYVEAAFWLARSLVISRNGVSTTAQVRLDLLDDCFKSIIEQAETLESLKKASERIIKEGTSISTGCSTVLAILRANVETIQTQISSLGIQ